MYIKIFICHLNFVWGDKNLSQQRSGDLSKFKADAKVGAKIHELACTQACQFLGLGAV